MPTTSSDNKKSPTTDYGSISTSISSNSSSPAREDIESVHTVPSSATLRMALRPPTFLSANICLLIFLVPSILNVIIVRLITSSPYYQEKTYAFDLQLHRSNKLSKDEIMKDGLAAIQQSSVSNSPSSPTCICRTYDNETTEVNERSNKNCKTLLLLRHAKSSWNNSKFIDDFDRRLSPKGMAVAHDVGKSLKSMNVALPEIILVSPSIRTRETLDIVMSEWIVFDETNKNCHGNNNNNVKNEATLKDSILYDDALYDLSDDGYLDRLVEVLNNGNVHGEFDDAASAMIANTSISVHGSTFKEYSRAMIVGHNPAMENLLNGLTRLAKAVPSKTIRASPSPSPWWHYPPGNIFELCFPRLTHWGSLK